MITAFELMTVQGDEITADLIIWRRYRVRAPGMFEAMLDSNPHLARIHKEGPFIPAGTQVRIPIDLDILSGAPKPRQQVLWADNLKV